LFKGKDPQKDQSYFLSYTKKNVLQYVRFPIGHLTKTHVRSIAKELGLHVQNKKDSTGICFVGKRKLKTFLEPYLGKTPGKICTLDKTSLGTHMGLAYYTIGQRQGLGLGGEGQPWFVVDKDPTHNILYVERGVDHPALFHTSLIADEISWIHTEPQYPYACHAKIRYRQQDVPCHIQKINSDQIQVSFATKQRAVTPGQIIVFYDQQQCLGGAKIIDRQ
jgi:tRNA-specific 2-thiouridylase